MNSGATSALLQLISAAVTPVVLISACAALILGINNKHSAVSDRLRKFAADLRDTSLESDRKTQVSAQISVFFQRFRLTWVSLASLYSAVIAFIVMIFVIILAQQERLHRPAIALSLFFLGIAFMLLAVAAEMLEIRLSIRSLEIELQDVMVSGTKRNSSGL